VILRLALVLAIATAVHAQAPPSFAKGVLAFEKGDYAEAERLLREAVAGNPNEVDGTVRISGQWFETYVPHYFLARALAKQGKCGEAAREFAESERQGVTPAIGDFARHLRTRGGCKPQAGNEAPPKKTIDVTVPFGDEVPVAKPATPKPATPKPVEPTPAVPKPVVLDTTKERQQLLTGIRAYLAGNYEEAVRALARGFTDTSLNAEAALFRGASRHALYRMTHDPKFAKQVAQDVVLYQQLKPGKQPDARIFPPSFIALTR
jgi:tetratricopeptide (TPR) repeat protein